MNYERCAYKWWIYLVFLLVIELFGARISDNETHIVARVLHMVNCYFDGPVSFSHPSVCLSVCLSVCVSRRVAAAGGFSREKGLQMFEETSSVTRAHTAKGICSRRGFEFRINL